MSDDFLKAVPRTDTKLLGRVPRAIAEISQAPMSQVGDTLKCLDRDLRGLWRYRIGNWRLVYHPDPNQRVVILLSFEPRGAVYQ